ncbi:MAG: TatD family hydrolase [Gammaproteobacteria bacterium]|nr:TatD family hydrolase [Gammaproteobacteria bacterium]
MPTYTLIDTHCHLDFINFDIDRDEVLQRAKLIGISDIIIPGVSTSNWDKIKTLCTHNKHLHPCYGLHPYWADQHTESDIKKLAQFIDNNPCVAIGECGLDYRQGQADKNRQHYFFEAQLDIAEEKNMPVVIHSVHATEEIIQQLRKRPGLRGMVHSYSGSYEQALQLIEIGFYISFGGPITYERASKLRAVSSQIPLSSLLIETDAPDQPDTSHKNQRNEPAYLENILSTIASLRQEHKNEIATQTTSNAMALFNIR